MASVNQYYLLPKKLSIENVSSVLNEIKKFQIQLPLKIDFKDVKEVDSSAISLFNYLKKKYPSVSFINRTEKLNHLFSLFPMAEVKTEKISKTSFFNKGLEGLYSRLHSFKLRIKSYFVLLADELYYTFQYLFRGRGIYPGEILNQLFFMGYKSFPIVTLIALLVGVTTSIISLQQLRNYGADIYIADLVGYGMVVEMVPLITGIIMSGKIGASITAEISSMKVLDEIDALKTMGIIPEKFLMVPRLIAITLAVPLLVAIADVIGIMAGIVVAKVVSGIPPNMFINEMFTIVGIEEFFNGMIKTLVFGWIIVITSGYKGFTVKQGAVGVGIATTQSVVLSISLIIVWDCIFAFIIYRI